LPDFEEIFFLELPYVDNKFPAGCQNIVGRLKVLPFLFDLYANLANFLLLMIASLSSQNWKKKKSP